MRGDHREIVSSKWPCTPTGYTDQAKALIWKSICTALKEDFGARATLAGRYTPKRNRTPRFVAVEPLARDAYNFIGDETVATGIVFDVTQHYPTWTSSGDGTTAFTTAGTTAVTVSRCCLTAESLAQPS